MANTPNIYVGVGVVSEGQVWLQGECGHCGKRIKVHAETRDSAEQTLQDNMDLHFYDCDLLPPPKFSPGEIISRFVDPDGNGR